MRHTQHDLEHALRHIKEIEQRITEQRARIQRLMEQQQPTEAAGSLLQGLELLKAHLADMTGRTQDYRDWRIL